MDNAFLYQLENDPYGNELDSNQAYDSKNQKKIQKNLKNKN